MIFTAGKKNHVFFFFSFFLLLFYALYNQVIKLLLNLLVSGNKFYEAVVSCTIHMMSSLSDDRFYGSSGNDARFQFALNAFGVPVLEHSVRENVHFHNN